MWRYESLVVSLLLQLGVAGASLAAEGPVPVSPGAQAEMVVVAGRCPTFHWTASEVPGSVDLVVYRVPREKAGPPARVLSVTLPGSAHGWTPSRERCLEPGGRYAWTVGGGDEWSEPMLFEVADGPSVEGVEEALALFQRYLADHPARDESMLPGPRKEELGERDGDDVAGVPEAIKGVSVESWRVDQPGGLASRRAGRGTFGVGQTPAAPPSLGTPSLAVDGNLSLGSEANLFKNGKLFLWNDLSNGSTGLGESALETNTAAANTAIGSTALQYNTSGVGNTAVGALTLRTNDTGSYNTAVGWSALSDNYTGAGSYNTAIGATALSDNTWGIANTAVGFYALGHNSNGVNNTAVGSSALKNSSGYYASDNTALGSLALSTLGTGAWNTALGSGAMRNATTGDFNTATGGRALYANEADWNTADGFDALESNSTGHRNTAVGAVALRNNSTGFQNTAIGVDALRDGTDGQNNTAIGFEAGIDASGSHNVLINNRGSASESNTLRIGRGTGTGLQQLNQAFIHGIYSQAIGGTFHAVYVDNSGKLGQVTSSRRFKEEIRDQGPVSSRLLDLRPVTFRLKKAAIDGRAPLQFGLIAEEVAGVFPELVVYDEKGRPETVKYHLLSSLLVNEVQKQHRRIQVQGWLLGLALLLAGLALTVSQWRFG